MGYNILHIADPHFSHCHFANLDPRKAGLDQAAELRQQLRSYPSLPPLFDAAILSGDFTFACRAEGFEAAVAFIDGIAPLVRQDGIVIVPGNHDIDLGKPMEIGKLSIPTPKEQAEAHFRRKLLKHLQIYVGQPNHHLSMVRRIQRRGESGLVIVGLNSCRVERRDAQGWGYVGLDQIYETGSKLLQPPNGAVGAQKGDLVLAVTHHNPLPIWDIGLEVLGHTAEQRKFSFMMDAASVLHAAADLGIGVLLHGHTHIQSAKRVTGYGSIPRAASLVLGAGSLGVRGSRGDVPHHFQIIEFEGRDLFDRDLTALASPADQLRQWNLSPRRDPHSIFNLWDPVQAYRALERLQQRANTAAWDYHISQSWAQLRSRRGGRWRHKLRRIYTRVRELESSATLVGVSRFVDRLLASPPPDGVICQWRLEQYIARMLGSR